MSKVLVLGAAALVFSAASASAQDYDYAEPVADLAAPADEYAAPTAPPVYMPAPAYAAPAVPPAVYTAPPVYAAPIYAPPPIYVVPPPVYAAPVVPGYSHRRGFAANICLRARVLGWLRAWVAWLRPQVWVALNTNRKSMPQPCEADFNIELLDGGVRVTFRPTTSEFTYRQLADPDDIAREGPLSRPPNVRHAQTGDTGGYDERERSKP